MIKAFPFRGAVAAILLAGLAACASGEDLSPNYYLLPEIPGESTAVYSGRTLALRELDLPLYARAAQVPHIGAGGAVALSDDHRWADEPQRAATRTIAASLRQGLNVQVVIEPWSQAANPELRIDVTIDRFVGALGGTLTLSGEFQLIALKTRQVVRSESFQFEQPVAGESFEALTNAHAAALNRLSETLISAIAETSGADG